MNTRIYKMNPSRELHQHLRECKFISNHREGFFAKHEDNYVIIAHWGWYENSSGGWEGVSIYHNNTDDSIQCGTTEQIDSALLQIKRERVLATL